MLPFQSTKRFPREGSAEMREKSTPHERDSLVLLGGILMPAPTYRVERKSRFEGKQGQRHRHLFERFGGL